MCGGAGGWGAAQSMPEEIVYYSKTVLLFYLFLWLRNNHDRGSENKQGGSDSAGWSWIARY